MPFGGSLKNTLPNKQVHLVIIILYLVFYHVKFFYEFQHQMIRNRNEMFKWIWYKSSIDQTEKWIKVF